MELNEGLAEYTGIMMSGRSSSETINLFEQKLTESQNWPTFVRSFAYVTTPIYGFILNNSVKNWDIVTLSEPTMITSDKISGKGWILNLNKGYLVEKNIANSNYTLKKK